MNMMGMGGKAAIRKKAMDSMMKEGPSMEFRRKREPELDELGGMEMGEEDQEQREAGMVQFMVSPEEKQAILAMRAKKKGQQQPDMHAEQGHA
jgi:hypothetical protein